MPPSRYIRLTDEEDARLREIEQNPYLKPKVRLRAQGSAPLESGLKHGEDCLLHQSLSSERRSRLRPLDRAGLGGTRSHLINREMVHRTARLVNQTACFCGSKVSRTLRKHLANTQPGIYEIASSQWNGSRRPAARNLGDTSLHALETRRAAYVEGCATSRDARGTLRDWYFLMCLRSANSLPDAPMSVKTPKRKKVGHPELSGSGRPPGQRTALDTAGSPSCSCPRPCAVVPRKPQDRRKSKYSSPVEIYNISFGRSVPSLDEVFRAIFEHFI